MGLTSRPEALVARSRRRGIGLVSRLPRYKGKIHFLWRFTCGALKNDQARSWIPENPTWSASKSGKEQLFCSTSGTECQMIQTSVKKKQHRLLLLAAKNFESLYAY
jgi:hypothetical protein